MEASSLSRQLQADLADFTQRVCRTLGVAIPHKGGKLGNEGESLTETLVAPTHAPLSAHLWGVSFFSAPCSVKFGR